MNIPDLNEKTWDLIEKYNKKFPRYGLGTLDLNPELNEEDLITYLEEAISSNTPIKDNDYRVYMDHSELPDGALW